MAVTVGLHLVRVCGPAAPLQVRLRIEALRGLVRAGGRVGQQQAQPGYGDRADRDAVAGQRAGEPGHLVAEHREPVGKRMPAAAVRQNAGRCGDHRRQQDDESGNL